MRDLTTGIDTALQNFAPKFQSALEKFGENFGLAALTLIGANVAKTGLAVKAGVVIAAPYVGAGVVVAGVGYGGYKVYRHYNPTPQQKFLAIEAQNNLAKLQAEQQLRSCLIKNQTTQRTLNGVPIPCQNDACAYAVTAGVEQADKALNAFNKYAPK